MANLSERKDEQLHAMTRSYVTDCLRQIWHTESPVADDDGDFAYRWGTAICWVRPSTAGPHGVEVFAYAAHSVRSSAKLLAEINDLNASSRICSVHYAHGHVVVQADLDWDVIGVDTLDRTMRAVGAVADDIGALIAAVYGGETPFDPDTEDSLADPEAPGEAA